MADVLLKDIRGNDVPYQGVNIIRVNKVGGGVQNFGAFDPESLTPEKLLEGETVGDVTGSLVVPDVLEDLPISLDFSGGNQTVTAPDGMVVKSAVIQKPENLIPDNIAEGVDIAGIIGTLAAGGGDVDGVIGRTATAVNLPNTDVGVYAFYEYDNLVSATVRNVGDYGFKNASNLENVVVTGTTLGRDAFYGAGKLKTIAVPNVTSFNAMGQIFYNCSSLEEVVFSADANYVSNGNYNFGYCTALKKVDFHMPVMLNNKGIFIGCSALTAIIMRGDRLYSVFNIATSTATSAILYNAPNAKFYVPAAMMETYAANTNWNTYITAGRLLAIEDYPEICGLT